MVIARIEHKPEQMGVGDDSQHLSNVVQNGLRTLRHHKDMCQGPRRMVVARGRGTSVRRYDRCCLQ